MKPQTFQPRGGRRVRRKALLMLLALLVAYAGYAFYVGLAVTAGIPSSEMDWDADGTVTADEIAQTWYAVAVKTTREGQRECHEFRWLRSGESIRISCRTTMAGAEGG